MDILYRYVIVDDFIIRRGLIKRYKAKGAAMECGTGSKRCGGHQAYSANYPEIGNRHEDAGNGRIFLIV